MKGAVFDVQRFSVHDGPGIRTTVFMKGCPLRCLWCQNPEGLKQTVQLWNFENLCARCGACATVCPKKALSRGPDGAPVIDHVLCVRCGKCIDRCVFNALALDGYEIDSADLAEKLLADIVFFNASGGGVTFSGGEPLQQADFVYDTAKRLRENGIHTAIETSLEGRWQDIERLVQVIDYFHADIKLFDADRHLEETGLANGEIVNNFSRLAKSLAGTGRLKARIPLIPDHTLDRENLSAIAKFVVGIDPEIPIEFMDYNPLAATKYRRMREDYALAGRVNGLTREEKKAACEAIAEITNRE